MAVSANRLHGTIPPLTNKFHQALDDLEAEIVCDIFEPLSSSMG